MNCAVLPTKIREVDIMKRFIAILLVITLLFSLTSVLTACDDGSASSSSSSKKNKNKARVFQGMTIGVGKSYELIDQGEDQATYSDGQYDISVYYFANANQFDTESFYSNYLSSAYSAEENGEITDLAYSDEDYYIAWTNAESETPIALAFYTTDASCWIVEIRSNEDAEEFDVEDMIDLVIGWKCSDPVDEDDEDEDDDDEDSEAETTAPIATAPTAATAAPSSASLKDLVIDLDDSFTTVIIAPTYAEYENDKYNVFVYFVYESGPIFESPEHMINELDNRFDNGGVENGVCYGYTVKAYGSFTYANVRGYYVKNGYGWIVEVTNPNGYYDGVSEMIDLATCHYFK